MTTLDRTKENPWRLKTPPGSSEYTMHVEEKDGKPVLVCTVGKTVLEYDARCIDQLHSKVNHQQILAVVRACQYYVEVAELPIME